jgi:hypothetical protein
MGETQRFLPRPVGLWQAQHKEHSFVGFVSGSKILPDKQTIAWPFAGAERAISLR